MRLVEIARFVEDVAVVTRFYRDTLSREPDREGDGLAEFDLGGVVLRFHANVPSGEGLLPSEDHLAFEVDDLSAAVAAMAAAGHQVELAPDVHPWGHSACPRDPEGRLVELCGRRSSVPVCDR